MKEKYIIKNYNCSLGFNIAHLGQLVQALANTDITNIECALPAAKHQGSSLPAILALTNLIESIFLH